MNVKNDSPDKRPRILVVDDEKVICDLLVSALQDFCSVSVTYDAESAFNLLDTCGIDIVITDLKLPGKTGIDVLEYAKIRDAFIEVIIITGYASIDSAITAINKGASSYLVKPVSMNDLQSQVQKAIASRNFHLKTLELIEDVELMRPAFAEHISRIAGIYSFSRQITLTLEVAGIARALLEEVNARINAEFSVVAVNVLGVAEFYIQARQGTADSESVERLLIRHCDDAFPLFGRDAITREKIQMHILESRTPGSIHYDGLQVTCVPMIVMGTTIGTIALFTDGRHTVSDDGTQYLYIISSIVAPLFGHGCTHRQALQQAETDALTGVANNRAFHEALFREIARSNRQGEKFCLLMLDVDDFKVINDTYGHQAGDMALRNLVSIILATIRISDYLARYGGEEFAVILFDTDINGGRILAERIRQAVCLWPFEFSGNKHACTVSIGIAAYSGASPETKEALVGNADSALYVSKKEGKNRVSVCCR